MTKACKVTAETEYPNGRIDRDEREFDSEGDAWNMFLDIAASVDAEVEPGSNAFSYAGTEFVTTVRISESRKPAANPESGSSL